jgi:methylphosphotriester-DNA--protein-cysteine methyltransferase
MGRPEKTEEERRARRDELLDAAVQAIRKQGPHVSMEDLARAAGVDPHKVRGDVGQRVGVQVKALPKALPKVAPAPRRVENEAPRGVQTAAVVIVAIVAMTVARWLWMKG